MEKELTITTERIDDFVLLLEMMKQMGLPEILDRHLARHWLEEGMSWGWVACIWLAHIVSQGDHRKVTVREWVAQAQYTLEQVTGLTIRDTDFTDDRLSIVLRHLSDAACWQAIEADLGAQTVQVYALERAVVRVDATTVSGYHKETEAGLMQFGYSKDDPLLRQVKLMLATLDPLGMVVASDVVSGEQADDPLYMPVIERVDAILGRKGLLFVGDAKLSALATRTQIQALEQYYLTPLAMTGETAQQMPVWIESGLDGRELIPVYAPDGRVLLAEGYEFTRPREGVLAGEMVAWDERVLLMQSPTYAAQLARGLEQRLTTAEAQLLSLTPPRGRGKRQIVEEAALHQATDAIFKAHAVEGLLHYAYERQVEQETRFVGRGRGGTDRAQRTVERIRYQITAVTRDEVAIANQQRTFGWRAYATNAPLTHLPFTNAVLTYRHQYLVENDFGLLKAAPLSIAPLYVKRDDQIAGLTHLLILAVRLLTLIEFVVRRQLHANQEELTGLFPQNPRQSTAKPTVKRLLSAFNHIFLTTIDFPDRVLRHLTPLTPLQTRILELLGLSPEAYLALASEIPKTAFPLRE
jgi:transposase